MQQHKQLMATPQRNQRGLTLIESLVAIFVTALGILGILGVQMRTLTDTQTTVRRAQAIRLIEDLSERLKANPNALTILDNYKNDWATTPPTGKNCGAALCNPTELAAYDLVQWTTAVKLLPQGNANIFTAPGESGTTNRRQLGVMISWRENERYDASTGYKDEIDATKVKASDGSLSAGAGTTVTCPTDRTCHLQYIPVSARCAPTPGGGATQYFCAGP